MSASTQELFFSWLSHKVSSAQLSDYYIVFSEIDSFCRNRNVTKTPFFEITDEKTINGIKNSLESNRTFRFLHRSSYAKMQSALAFYESFLKEKQGSFGALLNMYYSNDAAMVSGDESKVVEADKPETQDVASDIGNDETEVIGVPKGIESAPNGHDSTESEHDRELNRQNPSTVSYQVSFWVDKSYAFTRPTTVEYFGDEYSVSNWTQAYVQVVTLLYEDYPGKLSKLSGRNISSGRRADFAQKEQVGSMTAPKQITSDFFVETNLSASDIVDKTKRLLDICLIDYENLIITYEAIPQSSEELSIAAVVRSDDKQTMPQSPLVDTKKTVRSEFIGWMMEAGLKPIIVFTYLSALDQSSKFGLERGIIAKDFLQMSNVDDISSAYMALMANADFAQLNKEQHTRFRAAISKYQEYRNSTGASSSANADAPKALPTNAPILSAELKDRFALILRECFENGYRPGNAIDVNRFKLYYTEKYGSNPNESDEDITKTLRSVGAFRNGRIYAKADAEQRDVLSEIRADVDAVFSAGASCVYLETLFAKYQDQLTESLQIFNADSLKEAFLASCGGAYYSRYSYLASYKKTPDIENDVLTYMKASHMPVSYDMLKKDLWYIPFDKIKHILVTAKPMVNVAQEAYFYAPNLPVSADELKTIIELIRGELLQSSFISGTDLIDLLELNCPSVIINTDGFSSWGLRNALGYLLRDYFAFNGNIISSRKKEMNMSHVFQSYCAGKNRVMLDELKDVAIEAKTRIHWESVFAVMVRICQDEFVNKKDISFDVAAVDDALERFIVGEYASTKSINLFLQFPPAAHPWNGYMLESYVYSYSKRFKLVHPCFQQTDFCGAIVRKESRISEYNDLVVRVLADSDAWRDKKDALYLLTDEGYQQRKAYKDIDSAVSEARRQREQRQKQRG